MTAHLGPGGHREAKGPDPHVARTEAFSIRGADPAERILRALANRSRRRILECVDQGVSSAADLARTLNRPRSAIEKHLRMLRRAGLVEKVPSVTGSGQLTVRYRARGNVKELLALARRLAEG